MEVIDDGAVYDTDHNMPSSRLAALLLHGACPWQTVPFINMHVSNNSDLEGVSEEMYTKTLVTRKASFLAEQQALASAHKSSMLLALAMGFHTRLGQNSAIGQLDPLLLSSMICAELQRDPEWMMGSFFWHF